jgi:hypothetical protein
MTSTTYLKQDVRCNECGFVTRDVALFNKHSCDVQLQGGRCEDYPCCSHENGDCNGLLYGSDEAIKDAVYEQWNTGHGYCDHAAGIYNCDDDGEEPDMYGEED